MAPTTVTPFALNELVNGGLLVTAGDDMYPSWMVPPVKRIGFPRTETRLSTPRW
jgi:hypothetical protein